MQDDLAPTSRPRVLFFSPVPDFKGGAERSLLDLVSSPFIEPEIAVPQAGPLSEYFQSRNIPCHVIELGAVGNIRRPFKVAQGVTVQADALRAARQIKLVSDRSRISVIHSNGLKAHMINVIARRIGGPPAVTHIRDIANTGIEGATWRGLQLLSDRMVIVSRACWPGTKLPGNVRVIPNGVSCSPGQGLAGYKPAPAGGATTVGFIGRIHPSKGLHCLLDWIKAAVVLGLQVDLVVRGKFAPETPAYEQQIRDQVTKLRLQDRVRLEGFIDDPERVYAGLDIVCVPSIAPDPFPRAVMEAMGRGMVVIAMPSGGIPDLIDHNLNGFLVHDELSFVVTLKRLQHKPALGLDIGRQARAKCLERFTLEKLFATMANVYAEILRPPKPSMAALS